MRARTETLVPFAVGLLLATGTAWAQEAGVSVQVFNRSFEAIEVRILDAVCGTVLFEGQIFNESAVLVTPCTNADGEATITVENRAGQSETYPGLQDGATVQLKAD